MRVKRYELNFVRSPKEQGTQSNAYIYTINPYATSRYFNHPTLLMEQQQQAGAANRNRCVEQTSIVMYNSELNSIINIPNVPLDALRDYLIYLNLRDAGGYACLSFSPSFYNSKIESEADLALRAQGKQGYLFYLAEAIAKSIRGDIINNENNSYVIQETIKQFGFYFVYDNIFYMDAYAMWNAIGLESSGGATPPQYDGSDRIVGYTGIVRVMSHPDFDISQPSLINSGSMRYQYPISLIDISFVFDMAMLNRNLTVHYAYLYDKLEGMLKSGIKTSCSGQLYAVINRSKLWVGTAQTSGGDTTITWNPSSVDWEILSVYIDNKTDFNWKHYGLIATMNIQNILNALAVNNNPRETFDQLVARTTINIGNNTYSVRRVHLFAYNDFNSRNAFNNLFNKRFALLEINSDSYMIVLDFSLGSLRLYCNIDIHHGVFSFSNVDDLLNYYGMRLYHSLATHFNTTFSMEYNDGANNFIVTGSAFAFPNGDRYWTYWGLPKTKDYFQQFLHNLHRNQFTILSRDSALLGSLPNGVARPTKINNLYFDIQLIQVGAGNTPTLVNFSSALRWSYEDDFSSPDTVRLSYNHSENNIAWGALYNPNHNTAQSISYYNALDNTLVSASTNVNLLYYTNIVSNTGTDFIIYPVLPILAGEQTDYEQILATFGSIYINALFPVKQLTYNYFTDDFIYIVNNNIVQNISRFNVISDYLQKQVYRYYDYTSASECGPKVLGHGFVAYRYRFSRDTNDSDQSSQNYSYQISITASASSLIQYVPYLSGLLQFLIAVHLGYEPMLLVKKDNPNWAGIARPVNIVDPDKQAQRLRQTIYRINRDFYTYQDYNTDILIESYLENIPPSIYITKYYQYRLSLIVKNEELYIDINNYKLMYKVENIKDFYNFFESYGYSLLYSKNFSISSLKDYVRSYDSSSVNNLQRNLYKFDILFEYLTDVREEPCFIDTYEKIVYNITGEAAPIMYPDSNIDNRFYRSAFPSLIVYDSNTLEFPVTQKDVEKFYDIYRYKPRRYKYGQIEDLVEWGTPPLSSLEEIKNTALLVNLNSDYVAPPILDLRYMKPETLSYFTTFSLISTRHILEYPSVLDEYTFPEIGYSAEKSLYWREYLYNKYLRFIINYALHYLLARINNGQSTQFVLNNRDVVIRSVSPVVKNNKKEYNLVISINPLDSREIDEVQISIDLS